MKFDYLKLIIFSSWFFSLLFSGISLPRSSLYLYSTFTAGASLFLVAPQLKALSWFSCVWIAYLIAATEGKRSVSGVARKYFSFQFFGALLAIFGLALVESESSLVLVLIGVLCAVPTLFHSLFFSKFYESLTKRAYFFAIIVPTLVGIELLFSVKVEIKQSAPVLWEALLFGLGGISLLSSSCLALFKSETKSLFVYLTQAWIGLLLVLLASDNENVPLAVASVSVFLVNGFMVFLEAKLLQKSVSTLMICLLMGIPCFIGFGAIFYSIRSLAPHAEVALVVFSIALFFQAAALVLNLSKNKSSQNKANLRVLLLFSVSLFSAMAIHLVGVAHALD